MLHFGFLSAGYQLSMTEGRGLLRVEGERSVSRVDADGLAYAEFAFE